MVLNTIYPAVDIFLSCFTLGIFTQPFSPVNQSRSFTIYLLSFKLSLYTHSLNDAKEVLFSRLLLNDIKWNVN